MAFVTTDLCDAHEDLIDAGSLRVFAPGYLALGKHIAFAGPAATLRVFEDNAMVRSRLSEPGEKRVLVIDGGASMRCALVGGKLAELAQANGWAGIVVHGCVRDSAEINACEIGVRALGVHPQRSRKAGRGESDVLVSLGGVRVSPGDMIYVDIDGMLVCDRPLQ